MKERISKFILALALVIGCAGMPSTGDLENSGEHLLTVNTDNAELQKRVDRAMVLAYGFNHREAHKVFLSAAELDPDCAMCYWGAALVLGPNINKPMDNADVGEAYALVQKALANVNSETPRNRALIRALVKRYAPEPVEDRSSLDQAFADALREAAKQFPNDSTTRALFAESLMDLHPWNYWEKNGQARAWTQEILDTIEASLKANPDNILALHLHIHAVEASKHPEHAETSADRLRGLKPDSGHLLHMPAHIYMRIGRYADAAEVNKLAIANDQAYKAHSNPKGIYPLAYMPHNRHFLFMASANSGQSAVANQAAVDLSNAVDQQAMRNPAFGALQHFWIMPLYSLVRFGHWDSILNQPKPDDTLKYPLAIWHYARGRAYAGKGQFGEAERELREVKHLAADPELKKVSLWGINITANLVAIAGHVLEGELAFAQGNNEDALRHLEQAVELEDTLGYDEPPSWYYPARQSLGAVLMSAGRFAEAETVYRRDLTRHKNNGWSLYGLKESLARQGKMDEAEKVAKQFYKSWAKADVTLTASRF